MEYKSKFSFIIKKLFGFFTQHFEWYQYYAVRGFRDWTSAVSEKYGVYVYIVIFSSYLPVQWLTLSKAVTNFLLFVAIFGLGVEVMLLMGDGLNAKIRKYYH